MIDVEALGLSPCPFCGGKGEIIELRRQNAIVVQCTSCGAASCRVFQTKDDGREHLAYMWNRRPANELTSLRANVVALKAENERLRAASKRLVDAVELRRAQTPHVWMPVEESAALVNMKAALDAEGK